MNRISYHNTKSHFIQRQEFENLQLKNRERRQTVTELAKSSLETDTSMEKRFLSKSRIEEVSASASKLPKVNSQAKLRSYTPITKKSSPEKFSATKQRKPKKVKSTFKALPPALQEIVGVTKTKHEPQNSRKKQKHLQALYKGAMRRGAPPNFLLKARKKLENSRGVFHSFS